MSTRAVIDVYGIDVDSSQSPQLVKPVVYIYMPGFDMYSGYLPGADYPATQSASQGANEGIKAAARTLLEGAPYNFTFDPGDIVLLARGVSGL